MYNPKIEDLLDDIVYWWLDTKDSGEKTALNMAEHLIRRHRLTSGTDGQARVTRIKAELAQERKPRNNQ